MKLKPLQDWAVIRPSDAAAVTSGGLYIPDTAKDKPREGVVEAIGPGALEEKKSFKKTDKKEERRFIPTTVKPGDHVIYEQYAGQTVKIDGEERVLVRERNILGVLPEGSLHKNNKPILLPEKTSASGSTALMKADGMNKIQGQAKRTAKKTATKAAKKAAKKTAKKAEKKKSLKNVAKKAIKKAGKKAGRKTAAKRSKKR